MLAGGVSVQGRISGLMGAPGPGWSSHGEHIIVSDEGATRTIVMRRPDKKNALHARDVFDLSKAIQFGASHNPDSPC